jgi:hypothetical protein
MACAQSSGASSPEHFSRRVTGKRSKRRPTTLGLWGVTLLALFVVPMIVAQNPARVTAMEPTSGKVNDEVVLTGENLGKESVIEVNLSDDENDFKATVVDQASEKIVMKVPQVKAGRYNLSIKVKDRILILPLRFEVTE